MAAVNPLRYRGYFYDETTGFYYLQSRYYDPAICRYINADSYLSTGQGFLGYNAFAYCANNPVNYTDSSGNFLDTIFDVISIGFSIADVIANPTDPWAWAGLAGDLIDLVPFVSGVGETVKAIGTVADVVDVVDDVRDAAKVVDAIDNIHDTGKIVDNISDAGDSFRAYSKMDAGCPGGWCFVAGTLVYTEDGNTPIEDIEIGEYVWATDPETGELELKQVLNLFRSVAEEVTHIYVGDEEIVCTPGHDFYSPEYGWIDAEELQAGDVLVLPNGDYVLVEDTYTEELDLPVTIYNFEVEDFHTYFVGESHVLVHNSSCHNSQWDAERRRYWRSQANGLTPDPDALSESGMYQLTQDKIDRMNRGLAPKGTDGYSVNLHHNQGIANSFYDYCEILATEHRKNYRALHAYLFN